MHVTNEKNESYLGLLQNCIDLRNLGSCPVSELIYPEEEQDSFIHFLEIDWGATYQPRELNNYFFLRSRLECETKLYFDLRVVLFSFRLGNFDNLAVDIVLEHHSNEVVCGINSVFEDEYFQRMSRDEALAFTNFYVARYKAKFGEKRNSRTTWGDEANLLAIRNMAFVLVQ